MNGGRRLRKSTAAAAAITMALLLAGCGAQQATTGAPTTGNKAWDAVVEAATKEGEVRVYDQLSEPQNQRLIEAFQKEYSGIKLSITSGGAELYDRAATELASGTDGADAVILADPTWFNKHEDKLADIKGPSVNGWRDDSWVMPGKEIAVTALPSSYIIWNTDTFPGGFKKPEDLLKPSVKGKLGLRSVVTPTIAGYLDFLERGLGPDYLRGLAAQKPKFYPSIQPLVQAVASGEVGVTNIGTAALVQGLKDKGAPIDFVSVQPGFAASHGGAAFSGAKRPNAGRVFMDFVMSEPGQAAINGGGFGVPGREGIDGALSIANYTLFDFKKFGDPKVLGEWKTKFNEYFGVS